MVFPRRGGMLHGILLMGRKRGPVARAIVMVVQIDFVIPVDPRFFRVFRRPLNGFSGEVDKNRGFHPADAFYPLRGDQHFFTWKPVGGIDDDVPDSPALLVDYKIL